MGPSKLSGNLITKLLDGTCNEETPIEGFSSFSHILPTSNVTMWVYCAVKLTERAVQCILSKYNGISLPEQRKILDCPNGKMNYNTYRVKQ